MRGNSYLTLLAAVVLSPAAMAQTDSGDASLPEFNASQASTGRAGDAADFRTLDSDIQDLKQLV
jgi:hypothetical protein